MGQKLVGYLINGQAGERGQAYNYAFYGTGVFIEAENEFMFCSVPVALGRIRGLAHAEPYIIVHPSPIPAKIFEQAYLELLKGDLNLEAFVAITLKEGKFGVEKPKQTGSGAHLKYETVPNTVLEIHTHGRIKPFFSSDDNRDEQGFKIYMVLGRLMTRMRLRLGCYGNFLELNWSDVFEGPIPFNIVQESEFEDFEDV